MKKGLLFMIFLISFGLLYAQDTESQVKIGDTFTINKPENSSFQFVYFPRKNIIIKRGGIANMRSVDNQKVLVSAIAFTKGGQTLVTLKKVDGGRFFRSFPQVSANLEKALEVGELSQ